MLFTLIRRPRACGHRRTPINVSFQLSCCTFLLSLSLLFLGGRYTKTGIEHTTNHTTDVTQRGRVFLLFVSSLHFIFPTVHRLFIHGFPVGTATEHAKVVQDINLAVRRPRKIARLLFHDRVPFALGVSLTTTGGSNSGGKRICYSVSQVLG